MNTLTKEKLHFYLENLRYMVLNYNYKSINNIIFINSESFYAYYKNYRFGDYTIEFLLDKLAPFLPFNIKTDDLEQVISSIFVNRKVNIKTKIDFIFIVKNAKSEEDWLMIKNLCESIRYLKCEINNSM